MKYDSHHIDKILTALKNGDGRVRSVKSAGIAYETFMEWMRNKAEFSEQVKKAEDCGNDKIKDVCKRRIIEDSSWQSAAWWLERNYPDEFKNKQFWEGNMDGKFSVNPKEWVNTKSE